MTLAGDLGASLVESARRLVDDGEAAGLARAGALVVVVMRMLASARRL
jgi:hypothetical protein